MAGCTGGPGWERRTDTEHRPREPECGHMICGKDELIAKFSEGPTDPVEKLRSMLDRGEIVELRDGLYETDPSTPPHLIARHLCEPSYISFDYALSWHGIIRESTKVITCATCSRRTEFVDTPLGLFTYTEMPEASFDCGVEPHTQDGEGFLMADPEKAVCDKLYLMRPTTSFSELEGMMFGDLRFDDERTMRLDVGRVREYAERFCCTTVDTFSDYLESNRRVFRRDTVSEEQEER